MPNTIESCIVHGFLSVRAPFDVSDVSRAIERVRRKAPADPFSFAFVVGRNAGLDLLRDAERRKRAEAARAEKQAKRAAAEATLAVARFELSCLVAAAKARGAAIGLRLDVLVDVEIHGLTYRDIMAKYGVSRDNAYKLRQRGAELIWPDASPILRSEILRLRHLAGKECAS